MCQRVKARFFPSFSYYTPTKILVTCKSEKKVEELPEIYLTPVKRTVDYPAVKKKNNLYQLRF